MAHRARGLAHLRLHAGPAQIELGGDAGGPAADFEFEHIYVDNGSTDAAPQRAAAQHEHVEFLPTGGNIGSDFHNGIFINFVAGSASSRFQRFNQRHTGRKSGG